MFGSINKFFKERRERRLREKLFLLYLKNRYVPRAVIEGSVGFVLYNKPLLEDCSTHEMSDNERVGFIKKWMQERRERKLRERVIIAHLEQQCITRAAIECSVDFILHNEPLPEIDKSTEIFDRENTWLRW